MTVVAHFRSILGVNLELSVRSIAAHEQTIDALVKGNRKKALMVLEAHLMELGEQFKELADQLKHESGRARRLRQLEHSLECYVLCVTAAALSST